MDGDRFDVFTRSLSPEGSRRGVLAGLASGLLAAKLLARRGEEAYAKKKGKKKLKLNAFGCVNVGGKCRGNSANCCSGICEGKKPKKGKKDKSTCVAHDTNGCTAQKSFCNTGSQEQSNCEVGDPQAMCINTTGGAPFCGNLTVTPANCAGCRRDADCEAAGFPPGSACAPTVVGACNFPCAGGGPLATACLPPGNPPTL
jgi:hypothetical protein